MPKSLKYQYTALTKPDKFRLIKLLSAPNVADEVTCELIEDSLDTKQSYEALSWSWNAGDSSTQTLYINQRVGTGVTTTHFMITPHLGSSMRALRYPNESRYIWIDAICIDQNNIKERNNQVPLMDHIYGNAKGVCIWLGQSDAQSERALRFIRKIVARLWEFDDLCNDKSLTDDWAALISLMRKKWFSRRWVLQEIALAKSRVLFCGSDNVPWQDFADAVSLFKEVESATHRLSEIMKLDVKYHHVPEFFGEVPYLGAALLVDATSNLFRTTDNGRREPLSSLEYLVSKFGVFEATQPRDVIYAVLAISKDTTIQSISQESIPELNHPAVAKLIAWGRRNIASGIFSVDYDRPIVDVYKDFIEFSIRKGDPSRALDIICRPWAAPITDESDRAGMNVPTPPGGSKDPDLQRPVAAPTPRIIPLPSWIPSLADAAFQWATHTSGVVGRQMKRHNADALVGLPDSQRNYQAAGTRRITAIRRRFMKRPSYNSMFVHGLIIDKVRAKYEVSRNGGIPTTWLKPAGWSDPRHDNPPEEFWRTLVADRGPNGQNPPSYYRRACRESFVIKDPTQNPCNDPNPINTQTYIEQSRSPTIAEFLRRVQAVIWNRCLMHTEGGGNNRGNLGLVPERAAEGDLICIFFGCSVPIVLRRKIKSEDQLKQEQRENEQALEQEAWSLFRKAVERKRTEKSSMKEIRRKLSLGASYVQPPPPKRSITLNLRRVGTLFQINTHGTTKPPTFKIPNMARYHLQYSMFFLLTAIHLLWLVWTLWSMDLRSSTQGNTIAMLSVLHSYRSLTSKDFYDDRGSNILASPFRKTFPALSPTTFKEAKEWGSWGVWALILWRQLGMADSKPEPLENVITSAVLLFPPLPRIYWTCVQKSRTWLDTLLLLLRLGQAATPVANDESERYYYEVIGECYVHGMMNGEGLEIRNEKGTNKTVVFELR